MFASLLNSIINKLELIPKKNRFIVIIGVLITVVTVTSLISTKQKNNQAVNQANGESVVNNGDNNNINIFKNLTPPDTVKTNATNSDELEKDVKELMSTYFTRVVNESKTTSDILNGISFDNTSMYFMDRCNNDKRENCDVSKSADYGKIININVENVGFIGNLDDLPIDNGEEFRIFYLGNADLRYFNNIKRTELNGTAVIKKTKDKFKISDFTIRIYCSSSNRVEVLSRNSFDCEKLLIGAGLK